MKRLLVAAGIFFVISLKGQEVKWLTIQEAIEMNKKEPRKILVDVYTDWCGWCKVMDKQTFSNQIIAGYLNQKYYSVKFNAEQTQPVTINNTMYKYVAQGTRGYHELAAAFLNGQMSYPSVVFLDEKVQIIHVQKGYVEAKPFDEIIKFIGGDHFKTNTWEKWKAAYKSPFEN